MSEQGRVNSREKLTLDQWRSAIDDWHSSGLTISSYCRQRGLTDSVFRRWRRKLNVEEDRVLSKAVNGFIPVHVGAEVDRGLPSGFEIILANGHRLCIRDGIGWEGAILKSCVFRRLGSVSLVVQLIPTF